MSAQNQNNKERSNADSFANIPRVETYFIKTSQAYVEPRIHLQKVETFIVTENYRTPLCIVTAVQVAYGAHMNLENNNNTPKTPDSDTLNSTSGIKELPPFVYAFQVQEISYDMISEPVDHSSNAGEILIPDIRLPAKIDVKPEEEEEEQEEEKYHHDIVGLISEERTAKRLGALCVDASDEDEDGEECKCVVARSNTWGGL